MAAKLDVTEAAKYLGVQRNTLERHRIKKRPNHPPYTYILGRVMYDKADLDEYLAQRRTPESGVMITTAPHDPTPDKPAVLPPRGSPEYQAMVDSNAHELFCDMSGCFYSFDNLLFQADVKKKLDEITAEVGIEYPETKGSFAGGRY